MSHLPSLNIEELRCNAFAEAGLVFDMCRLEDFLAEATLGTSVHRHNYYMVMMATAGEGSQLIDFEQYGIEAGRIFLMSPGQVHAWGAQAGLKGYLVFFTPSFFTQRYNDNNLREFPFFNSSYWLPYIDTDRQVRRHLVDLLECMLREYEQRPEDHLKTLRSYLNILLYECKRLYHYREDAEAGTDDQNARLLLRQFEQLIEAHFREKRMVRDYAELLLLTPNYLNAVCKKATGKPAGELIRERVMLEAKRLLLHDRRSVAEISNLLHFEDNSYFGRFFKKYAGSSPEQFRKQYKN